MSRNGKTLGETWFTGVTLLRKLSKAWRCRLATHIFETLVQLLLGSIEWSFSPVCSFHYPSPKFPGRSSRKKFFWLCERAFRSRLPCGKRVRWSSWEETPNGLGAAARYQYAGESRTNLKLKRGGRLICVFDGPAGANSRPGISSVLAACYVPSELTED